jgi:proteasome lid subunit RPN8/RPN11
MIMNNLYARSKMLKVPQSILNVMIELAKRDTPIETCGYLAGIGDEVRAIFPLTNTDASAEHFSFDPAEQFEALKAAQQKGLNLIACYHSHPETPARPSQEDIRLAFDPNIHYVIVSLAGEAPDVRSFKIKSGIVEHESLEALS